MSPAPAPWLLGPPADDPSRTRVFCFPHAGSGASAFTAWRARLPEPLELCPVQLPGRESRFGDPMPDTMEELTEQTAQALLPFLRPPFVLLGHSFGGLLAYALTRYLRERGLPPPRALLISGARPPHVPAEAAHHTWPHERLVEHLRATGGVPDVLLQHEEFVRRLLQILRTDLRTAAGYRPAPAAPLACPVEVFAALDDPVVAPSAVAGWREYAGGEFGVHRGPGGHYAVYDTSGDLFGAVVRSALAPRPGPGGDRASDGPEGPEGPEGDTTP
ncbi:thioesterase II family protein [Streptomyces sp. NPDC094437]|uniref:thioesterase II family protein n=1 Tax=Streptomyces sp. NPDC094437 TaxID=3366060 RepID=UPI00381D6365